jgi:predicted metal-dependent phosphoesterase TrpH
MAKEKGLVALAVSDHDSLEGSKRALVKGEELGVEIVPAVEISTALEGRVLHILAYGIDLDNSKLSTLLKETNDYRLDRAKVMVENINKELELAGKPLLDIEAILNLGKEKPLTRADIALYLVALGYVKTRQEAFDIWLNKYNIPNKDLTIPEVCEVVHEAGGVAILAHPNSEFLSLNEISVDFEKHKQIILGLQKEGLDGIEAYRDDQSKEGLEKYVQFAKSVGLIVTGGSDFHGAIYSGNAPEFGSAEVPNEVLNALKERFRG